MESNLRKTVLISLLWLGITQSASTETLLEQLATQKAREIQQQEDKKQSERREAEAQREAQRQQEQLRLEQERLTRIRQAEAQRQQELQRLEQERLNKPALTVNTTPREARIRIMNIKPVYKPGISLKPGSYRIQVDHPGYETHQQVVQIKQRHVTVDITLQALAMAHIKKGCFMVGQSAAEKAWLIQLSDEKTYNQFYNDEKQHEVCIEDDFYLAKTEVTKAQFKQFVAATGYKTGAEKDSDKGCWYWNSKKSSWEQGKNRSWKNPGFKQTDQHPVVCVSWNDARAYTRWLSDVTGKTYRLPTEAQWEYAARAGTTTFRYWGDDKKNRYACGYANVADLNYARKYNFKEEYTTIFICKDRFAETSPVATFKANPWGLHDMLGNVWEWTCSAYDANYGGSEKTCANANDSRSRVLRGGSWNADPWLLRSADRYRFTAEDRNFNVGFRVSRTP